MLHHLNVVITPGSVQPGIGNGRSIAPVARMMCGAVSVATSLPSFVTARVCLPASRPCPSNTAPMLVSGSCRGMTATTLLQTFLSLRVPSSVPFLFASLKVGVAASLVGTIVAEVTKKTGGVLRG